MKSTTAPETVADPTPPRDYRRAIGTILVELGRLSTCDTDRIDRYAAEKRLRFGHAAVQLTLVSKEDIDFALEQQFKYPIIMCGGDKGLAEDVIAAYDPQSEAVEPLRALRSQLTLRWRNKSHGNALTITSADRSDGRSWLAANLATVFAQGGDRTLLIDTDMRHPCQHGYSTWITRWVY